MKEKRYIMRSYEKTKVWRYFTEVAGVGYFIWEINECDNTFTQEDMDRYPGGYLKTADGGFMLTPVCDFFWRTEDAYQYYYTNVFPDYVELNLLNAPVAMEEN